jgi:general secretion pathway protein G
MTLSTFKKSSAGFSLFELVMTLAVLSVMILAAIPLLQNSMKRQKEQDLREALRDIRAAIDEFKRDSIGACPMGNMATQNLPRNMQQQVTQFDPRSRVMVDDCTLFTMDNLDRYPPTLEDLVNGVKVKSRMPPMGQNNPTKSVFDQPNATEINENKEIIKIYLRKIPVDPMTGEAEWLMRSSYQDKDSTDWDRINVFDVRSKSSAEAMNGDKYSDW